MQVGKPITQSLSSVLDFFFFFFPSVAVLGSASSETSRFFFFFFLGVPFSSASPLACATLFSCSCGSSSSLCFFFFFFFSVPGSASSATLEGLSRCIDLLAICTMHSL
uniref:Uncharacterized protein n=1 Tax=Oryza rufipogon TaxID=4529 RepID=A0A0E0NV32_ORYRU